MKGIIKVVTQQEFDLWLAKQKTNYAQVNEADKTAPANTTADSATAPMKTAALTPVQSAGK
jgi:cytochrome c oxidase subunit 2